jgi:trigger factor
MIKTTVKKLEKSMVEITGSLPADTFEAFRPKAIKKIGSDFEMPGFRKGKVPEEVLIKNIPASAVLEEMAELALAEHYPQILDAEDIDAIGRPEITITKLAPRNPLEFKIQTAILPKIELPDYKSIAKEKNKDKKTADVTDEEIDKALLDIRKMRAHQKLHEDNIPHEEHAEMKDEDLPELTDEFIQTLGDFKNSEELRAKIRENVGLEKEREAKDKNRISIIEDIVKETKAEIPEILIRSELEKMMARFEDDISRMGFKFDDYLKQINKTREDIEKEWTPDATKRASWELIVDTIARAENITPEEKDVEAELSHLLEQYGDADPIRARVYVQNVLINEKVFQFLESLS